MPVQAVTSRRLSAALVAAIALAAAPLAPALADGFPSPRWCGGHGDPTPLPGHRREGGNDCPGACHTACNRANRTETDDEDPA